MIKVGIVGAPSSGKTTLAEGISFAYKSKGNLKRIALITEYAREFVKDFKIPTTSDQKHILDKQLENEQLAEGASLMITDSPFWLSYIYACHASNPPTSKDSYYINQIHQTIINKINYYDIIIFLQHNPDFLTKVNIKDGQRVHDDVSEIINIDKKIEGFMNLHGIEYKIVRETDADMRLKEALSIVDGKLGAIK